MWSWFLVCSCLSVCPSVCLCVIQIIISILWALFGPARPFWRVLTKDHRLALSNTSSHAIWSKAALPEVGFSAVAILGGGWLQSPASDGPPCRRLYVSIYMFPHNRLCLFLTALFSLSLWMIVDSIWTELAFSYCRNSPDVTAALQPMGFGISDWRH